MYTPLEHLQGVQWEGCEMLVMKPAWEQGNEGSLWRIVHPEDLRRLVGPVRLCSSGVCGGSVNSPLLVVCAWTTVQATAEICCLHPRSFAFPFSLLLLLCVVIRKIPSHVPVTLAGNQSKLEAASLTLKPNPRHWSRCRVNDNTLWRSTARSYSRNITSLSLASDTRPVERITLVLDARLLLACSFLLVCFLACLVCIVVLVLGFLPLICWSYNVMSV